MTRETILILGGTREAAELASRLVIEKPYARIITSLAGRTREPKPVSGEVRIGGFGGAEGLAAFLRQERVTQLVDATHPFALRISINAKRAADIAGIMLETFHRAEWQQQPDDDWHRVASIADAVDAIPTGATVLLALGAQHIAAFARRSDARFIVRMVSPPQAPLALPNAVLLLGRPGTTPEDEMAVLTTHAITHIVCRNSGGAGAYAKIEAARRLGLPVIMIERPVAS